MVTLDDIAAAVKARCAASAEFAAALPGGAWLDRGPPDTPAGNYAILTVTLEGEPEWFSDSSYLQDCTVRMAAYAVGGLRPDRSGPPAPGAAAPAQAAQLAMAAAMNPGPTSWAPLRSGGVSVCLPRGYDGEHAPQLREGRDVFAAAAQWHLLIEGSLSP